MANTNNLQRFITAQETDYLRALSEIENGRKLTHWIWYIFPQIAGLGFSETSKLYAIKDINEANFYIAHPVLGPKLIQISNALLELKDKTAIQVFGSPDDLKLKSCMTLFSTLQNASPVFKAVLDKYFNGDRDLKTLQLIQQ
jgi:uncharacterized protein (DUF1810 family)